MITMIHTIFFAPKMYKDMADKKMNDFMTVNDVAYLYGENMNNSQGKIEKSTFLKVSAYAQFVSNCNFDDLLPGEYYVSGELQNAPSAGDWFMVKVIGTSDLIQFAISVTDDTLWKRTKMNSFWKEWKSISFT